MAEPQHDKSGAPRQVGLHDFRGNMTGLPRQVRQGTSFLITSHGAVVAEIHPPSASVLPPRQPGALRGRIRIAPDFDIMPEDILAAMESTLSIGEADAG